MANENLVEQYMKANCHKDRDALVIKQLVRKERENPPKCCLECIFYFYGLKDAVIDMWAYCGGADKEIEEGTDVDNSMPEWCPLK